LLEDFFNKTGLEQPEKLKAIIHLRDNLPKNSTENKSLKQQEIEGLRSSVCVILIQKTKKSRQVLIIF
jgi:hypothetical protein